MSNLDKIDMDINNKIKCAEVFYENQCFQVECFFCNKIFGAELENLIEHLEKHLKAQQDCAVRNSSPDIDEIIFDNEVNEIEGLIDRKNQNNLDEFGFINDPILLTETENFFESNNNSCSPIKSDSRLLHIISSTELSKTDNLYHCPYKNCVQKSKSKELIKMHIILMHIKYSKNCNESDEYQCCNCDSTLQSKRSFLRHLKNVHGILTSVRINPSAADLKYYCPICNDQRDQSRYINKHLRNKHEDYFFELLYNQQEGIGAKKNFVGFTKNDLQHRVDKNDTNQHNTEMFKCELCEKQFSRKHTLVRHKLNAHKINLDKCVHCKKRICSCTIINHHHTDGVLNNEAVKKSKSNNDIKIVNFELDFEEEIIEKDFIEKLNNKNHKSQDNTEMFKCELCEKPFSRKFTLVRHKINVHKINLDKCIHCKKGICSCTINTYLPDEVLNIETVEKNKSTNDIKIVNFELDFEEEIIEEDFIEKLDDKNHKSQDNTEMFKCELCEKLFSRKYTLDRHKINVHKINLEKCIHCKKRICSCSIIYNHPDRVQHNESVEKNKCNDNIKIENFEFNSEKEIIQEDFIEKLDDKNYKSQDNTEMFKCELCEKPFSRKYTLDRHKINVHKINLEKCIHCKKRICSCSIIYNHPDRVQHNEAAEKNKCNDNTKIENFELNSEKEIILEEFIEKLDDKNHKSQDNTEMFKCELCEKLFSRKYTLDRHKINVHKINLEKCIHCKKRICSCSIIYNHPDRVQHNESVEKNKCNDNIKIENFEFNSEKEIIQEDFIEKLDDKNYKSQDNTEMFKCELCEKPFSRKYTLDRHKINVHKINLDKCIHCKKVICICTIEKNKSYFKNVHFELGFKKVIIEKLDDKNYTTQDNTKIFTCELCEKQFSRKYTLDRHKLNVHKMSLDKCIRCTKSFCSCTIKNKYPDIVLNSEPVKKSKSNNETKTKNLELEFEGKELAIDLQKMETELSNISEESNVSVAANILLNKPVHTVPAVQSSNVDNLYHCPYENCNRAVTSENLIQIHMIIIHIFDLCNKNDKFQCPKCNLEHNSKETFIHHLRDIHGIFTTVPSNLLSTRIDDKYYCPHCNEEFTLFIHLSKHLKTNHEDYFVENLEDKIEIRNSSSKPKNRKKIEYHCNICGKVVLNRKGMYNHHLSHKERSFQCKYCNKKLISHINLLSHMEIHIGDRKYKCDYCDRVFARNPDRASHVNRTHIKTKKKICEICGKGFYTKTELINHIQRHTGEKTFKCDLCNKCYYYKWHLKTHMESHAKPKGKRFPCQLCNSEFSSTKTLKAHKVIHSNEKKKPLQNLRSTF